MSQKMSQNLRKKQGQSSLAKYIFFYYTVLKVEALWKS